MPIGTSRPRPWYAGVSVENDDAPAGQGKVSAVAPTNRDRASSFREVGVTKRALAIHDGNEPGHSFMPPSAIFSATTHSQPSPARATVTSVHSTVERDASLGICVAERH